MDDTDVIEIKRAHAPEELATDPSARPPRPSGDAPAQTSSQDAKIEWCASFVRWAHPAEALDAPHPDSGVHGHLWRVELSSCLLDPQGYERHITQERNQADEEKL